MFKKQLLITALLLSTESVNAGQITATQQKQIDTIMSQYINNTQTASASLQALYTLYNQYQTPAQQAAQKQMDALISQIHSLQTNMGGTAIGQQIQNLNAQINELEKQIATLEQQLNATPDGQKMTGLYKQLDQAQKAKNALPNPYADFQQAVMKAQQEIARKIYN